jgi:RNA polymerase sigma-70 factor (ECF subfamily)
VRRQTRPVPGTGPDDAAFEELVARHGQRIYALAYRMAGNEADARDLAQEALIRVWRARHTVDPTAALEGWLYRIVTNLFIDALRRRPRVRVDSLDAPVATPGGGQVAREVADPRADPEAAVLEAHLDADVQAALLALSVDLRAVVVLCDIEGYSYEEIAGMLQIPVGTVKSRLHRARRALADRLRHRLEGLS